MKLNQLNSFQMQTLLVLACLFGSTSTGFAQVSVQMHETTARCSEATVAIRHVAKVVTNDRRMAKRIESLDIDAFSNDATRIEVTKEHVRIRLVLAGLSENQFELSGPESVSLEFFQPQDPRQFINQAVKEHLSGHFHIPIQDVNVKLAANYKELERNDLDFSTLEFDDVLPTEIPLGRQTIAGTVHDHSGQPFSTRIPVSIALTRELAVAKQNISKGETLGPENIELVRRPVASRNVQFASFEQALGLQVQQDIQQYDVIKSNLVQNIPVIDKLTVKNNSLVNIVFRRGALKVVLKDAKALGKGQPGEKIVVLNPSTKEKMLAVVVNSSTVEVR